MLDQVSLAWTSQYGRRRWISSITAWRFAPGLSFTTMYVVCPLSSGVTAWIDCRSVNATGAVVKRKAAAFGAPMIFMRCPMNSRQSPISKTPQRLVAESSSMTYGPLRKVLQVSFHHVPRHAPLGEMFHAVHLHPFLHAVGQRHADEPDDQVVGALHAIHRAHAVHVRVGKRAGEVDVGRVLGGDPDLGVEVVDRDRGVVEQPQEEAALHQHQRHREPHPANGDEEPQLVVQENLAPGRS